jgi:hypothetical protein
VIENNPNKNVIISMSMKQGFRYPKKRRKRDPPPILVNSNEGSFIGEKSSNNATRCFYIS